MSGKGLIAIIGFTVVTAGAPRAAEPGCGSLHTPLTIAARKAEAARVSRVAKDHVDPSGVGLILTQGAWRLVWATPVDAERGVYFFKKDDHGYRLVDTWGGVIAPDERNGTVRWAQARAGHPPHHLAACFADALASEP